MTIYVATDWYWLVAGDETRVWSSGRGTYVPADDLDYAAWREAGRAATRIATEQDLTDVLAVYGMRGPHVDLVAYAADARWRRETGGITIDGLHIATDDRSKLLIAGARIQAEADPAWSTVWTAADGTRHPVTAAHVIAISAAVLAHVDAGFRIYDQVLAGIASGTITTPAEIDAAFAAV